MTLPDVHPTAVVSPAARLGPGTAVGPLAVVEAEAVLGENNQVAAHAVIKRFTRIGSNNQIFEGAVLGGIPQDTHYSGEQSCLIIGDRNVFREGVTVHRATGDGRATQVGNDNFVMAYAHVAHNCVLESHVILANNVALAGHVHIEARAFLSGGVVVHQFCRIGAFSLIGGNSKITQDVLPYFTTDGIPGRVRGLNLVGLRRGGFSREAIAALKEAYRILFTSGGPLKEKLARLRELETAETAHLAQFIEASRRGFCGA